MKRFSRISLLMPIFRGIAAACALAGAASFTASAQTSLPSNLNWQPMSLAVFNSTVFKGSAGRAEIGLASNIWSREIAALPPQTDDSRALPGFVLVGVASLQNQQLVFSSMHALGLCPPAVNSRSAEDIYVECPLRITRYGPASEPVTRELADFCFLYSDDENNPAALNHTEYAFDEATSTAYFRIIQHGRQVPECNRSVTIKP